MTTPTPSSTYPHPRNPPLRSLQTTSLPLPLLPPPPPPPPPPILPSLAQHHPPQTNFMPPLPHCKSGLLGSHAQNASPLHQSHTLTQTTIGQRNSAGSSNPPALLLPP